MAKKKKEDAEEKLADGSVVLFTALSMIMLAFFIVLNSMAVIDQNKKIAAMGSLLGSFGLIEGGILMDEGDVAIPYESPVADASDVFEVTMSLIEKYAVQYQLSENLHFSYEGKDLSISVGTDILFLPGTSSLNPKLVTFLNLITRLVGTVENRIRVEGYIDLKEAEEYNIEPDTLSLERAIAVMEHMVTKGKIDEGRFSVGGYGTRKPAIVKPQGLKRKNGRVSVTFVGEVEVKKKEEEGVYRYKGFIFDFGRGGADGER